MSAPISTVCSCTQPEASTRTASGSGGGRGGQQLKSCACQNGHAVVAEPGNPDHVLLSTNDGGLLETEDGGHSWGDGGLHGLVTRAPRGIAFDPQEPRRVYVGAFTGTQGIFKS